MRCFTVFAAALPLVANLAIVATVSPVSAQTPKPAQPTRAGLTVVLPLSQGSEMALVVHPVLPTMGKMIFWTPTATDLRRLEAETPKTLTFYYRQYIGAKQGGKRLILINGFAASVAPDFAGGKSDWHKATVFVMDGGHGFFQATYDPNTHVFTGPHFNGMG